jgi:hypothetical protein
VPAVGVTYAVTARISSWVGTSAAQAGSDMGATITVLTIDNTSPTTPTAVTGRKTSTEQISISYTTSATTDAYDTLILRSLSTTTDQPAEGTNYVAGNTIGASTVVCVASSSPASSVKTCTFTTPTRNVTYYFKLFTKDATGNYSLPIAPSNAPFTIVYQNSGRVFGVGESETSNGATTTVTGATGHGGGYGDTGTTTTATTTVSTTTPSKGGGGGDSGFIYNGSNLASLFQKVFELFLGQTVTGAAPSAYADEPLSPSTHTTKTCLVSFFGICIISNFPNLTQ